MAESTSSGIFWTKRSKKHEAKFESLRKNPPEKTKIYYVRFNQQFMIGEGRDGTCVYIGLSDDGTEVAVKRVLTHICSQAENEQKILKMMKMEKSEHIVRYRYCWKDDTFTYLVLELCEETLADYVHSHGQEELTKNAPKLIREILSGLLVLHGTGGDEKILHMDLKPWNILVDVEGKLRLADFGISRKLSQNSSTVRTGAKATRYWRAVESLPREDVESREEVKFKRKSDIQVAGMVCHYILTKGGHPFGEEYNRDRNLSKGDPVNLNKISDLFARDLVSWMVQHEIEDRPFAQEALKHPYLQERDQMFDLLVRFGNENEIKDKEYGSPDAKLARKEMNEDPLVSNLNWKSKIDPEVLQHMEKRVNYDDSVAALLRFIRNASEHWKDRKTPEIVREKIVDPVDYFLTRFPELVIVVHRIVRKRPQWRTRPQLKNFFILEK